MKDKLTPFQIEHIDPLGQGVSKLEEKITFIAKTLPNEEGLAQVLKSKKGVQFAQLKEISRPSPERISPICSHYEQCPSCHYLHTSYEQELEFKRNTLLWAFKKIPPSMLKDHSEAILFIHSSKERLHYRNRIQLHYDRTKGKLGFIDALKNDIIQVPNCLIAVREIQKKLHELYQNWQKLCPQNPKTGHVEIALQEDCHASLAFNQNYAHHGFTQVHKEMNEKLLSLIQEKVSLFYPSQKEELSCVDLFGGNGNLSAELEKFKTTVVDMPSTRHMRGKHQDFFPLDLYKNHAPNTLQQKVPSTDLLILDPPRSGLKNIASFTKKLSPKDLFYVSCNIQTLVRDLNSLKGDFIIQEIHLLDFFPSTYHFETFIAAQRV